MTIRKREKRKGASDRSWADGLGKVASSGQWLLWKCLGASRREQRMWELQVRLHNGSRSSPS